MKTSTKEFLLQYIQSHYLNDEYTLHQLFYGKFAELEFTSFEDFYLGINEFFDFILKHKSLIKFNPETIMPHKLISIIENEKHNVELYINSNSIDSQNKFVSAVSAVFDNPEAKSVLDVGPGHMPISSLLLSKKFKRVTAMDSHFYLSQIALQKMNVIGLNEYFNIQTDISEYDFIVGRAPCEAIESIVKNCAKSQKPYLIKLCGCSLKPEYMSSEDSFGWEKILPQIDPNIRFYEDFAYNLHNLPNHVLDALKTFIPKKVKYKSYDFPIKKPYVTSNSPKLPANEIEFD